MSGLRTAVSWIFAKRRRAALFCIAVLTVGWFIFFARRRERLRTEKTVLIAALRARGEATDLADFAAIAGRDDPGLRHLCRALLALDRETASHLVREPNGPLGLSLKRLVGDWTPPADPPGAGDWMAIDFLDDPKPDPKLTASVRKLEPAFAELERACERPAALFPHNFESDKPSSILLPQVQDMRSLARACRAGAFEAIAAGDARRAWRFTLLGVRLPGRLDAEAFPIPKLVQAAVFHVAFSVLEKTLASFDPTPDEFEKLDAALDAAERFQFREAILGDQAATLRALDRLNVEEILNAANPPLSRVDQWALQALVRYESSWIGEPARLEEQIWLLANLERRLKAADDLGPAGATALKEHDADLGARRTLSIVARLGLPLDVLRTAKHRLMVQAHLARSGLRLGRHRALYGRLPDSLAAVADAAWSPETERL
ncbi:MAG TPA: hypothetical protein VNC50_03350, partial [Planctomycetia bacterium]|nr:hypothetical protein [Planctomycetia bacterium]